jgi:hypothetical protein
MSWLAARPACCLVAARHPIPPSRTCPFAAHVLGATNSSPLLIVALLKYASVDTLETKSERKGISRWQHAEHPYSTKSSRRTQHKAAYVELQLQDEA